MDSLRANERLAFPAFLRPAQGPPPRDGLASRLLALTAASAAILISPATGRAAATPTFRLQITGEQEAVLQVGSSRHEISMHFEGQFVVRPHSMACDAERFLGTQVRLEGSFRVRGRAVKTEPGGSETLNFDISDNLARPNSHTDVKSTPGAAEHLYLITRDTVYVPPDEVTVYALEYVSESAVARVWIGLPEPFSYPAQYEHYDFSATHTVEDTAGVPGCVLARVTAEATGLPVPDAKVSLGGWERIADVNGRVEFSGLPPGRHEVQVLQSGFEPIRGVLELVPFAIDHYELPLSCCRRPTGPPKEIEFESNPMDFTHRVSEIYRSEVGEALVVWWVRPSLDPLTTGHYELRYYAAGTSVASGTGTLIGRCLFNDGLNAAAFSFSDQNGDGEPDCFVKVTWQNFDYGEDDSLPLTCTGRFDKYEWEFAPASGVLTQTHACYDYPAEDCRPPLRDESCWAALQDHLACRDITEECAKRDCAFCREPPPDAPADRPPACTGMTGGRQLAGGLGITEEFEIQLAAFNRAHSEAQPAAMARIQASWPDTDFDGAVTAGDFVRLAAAFRTRRAEAGYLAMADVDGDLQVEVEDLVATLPGDSDTDGSLDWQEVIAGSDPLDPASRFRVAIEQATDGSVRLHWPGAARRLYDVYRAETAGMASERRIADGLAATPPLNSMTDLENAGLVTAFYRVVVR